MKLIDFITVAQTIASPDLGHSCSNLMSYLSWSPSKNFKYDECYEALVSRTPPKDLPPLGFAPHEKNVFVSRAGLIATDNEAYMIAMRPNPGISELNRIGEIKPSWSILMAVKAYLWDHPETAKEYRGLQPFGSEVTRFYNAIPGITKVGPQPSFKDHVDLMNLTNRYADLTGLTPVAVNTWMYLEGKDMA